MRQTARRPRPLSITAIGSVPHTQLELALQQALALDVPGLPELPRRAPAEAFVAQALEGLPGLRVGPDGLPRVDLDAWAKGAGALEDRLENAIDAGVVEPFAPTATATCAWSPFLWEVESRRLPFAKVQCAGPATALAVLSGGTPLPGRLAEEVVQLVHFRALAMARAVRQAGAMPIVFLDEPMLGAVRRAPAAEQARELELLWASVHGLRGEGAVTGVHCCGEADWAPLLRLGLDVLSFDATLSLERLLAARPELERYLDGGGWLGLGVVPTDVGDRAEVARRTEATLRTLEGLERPLRERLLSQSLLTPACGLATRSAVEAGQVFEALAAAQERLRALAG